MHAFWRRKRVVLFELLCERFQPRVVFSRNCMCYAFAQQYAVYGSVIRWPRQCDISSDSSTLVTSHSENECYVVFFFFLLFIQYPTCSLYSHQFFLFLRIKELPYKSLFPCIHVLAFIGSRHISY